MLWYTYLSYPNTARTAGSDGSFLGAGPKVSDILRQRKREEGEKGRGGEGVGGGCWLEVCWGHTGYAHGQ